MIAVLEDARKIHPDNSECCWLLARANLETDDIEAAENYLNEAKIGRAHV